MRGAWRHLIHWLELSRCEDARLTIPVWVDLLWSVRGFDWLWIVAAALAGHGVFDAVHGALVTNPGVPVWWPAFCLAFDVTAASAMLVLLRRRGVLAKELWQTGT